MALWPRPSRQWSFKDSGRNHDKKRRRARASPLPVRLQYPHHLADGRVFWSTPCPGNLSAGGEPDADHPALRPDNLPSSSARGVSSAMTSEGAHRSARVIACRVVGLTSDPHAPSASRARRSHCTPSQHAAAAHPLGVRARPRVGATRLDVPPRHFAQAAECAQLRVDLPVRRAASGRRAPMPHTGVSLVPGLVSVRIPVFSVRVPCMCMITSLHCKSFFESIVITPFQSYTRHYSLSSCVMAV